MPSHLAVEARPEEGVDDPVRVEDRRPDRRDLLDALHLDGKPRDDLPVGLCRPAEALGVPDEEDPGGPAAGEDVPRHDEAVAAVVPGPAEEDIPPPGDPPLPGEDLEGRPPGVFHEDLLGYPELLDGLTVHRPHLHHAADLHLPPPVLPLPAILCVRSPTG